MALTVLVGGASAVVASGAEPLLMATLATTTTPASAPAAAATKPTVHQCIADTGIVAARNFARTRGGMVGFAIYENGAIRSFHGGVPFRSASVVKAMLLVAELQRVNRSGSPLSAAMRSTLHTMIHLSDNEAATDTWQQVGDAGLESVARQADMTNYHVYGSWGSSQITAADQSRLMGHLDHLLPNKYEKYARGLLRGIVGWESWGVPTSSRRHGYVTMFKGGWLPRTGGWLVHQSARLERGSCRVGLSILTSGNSSMEHGEATIAGVTRRLLQG